MSEAEQQLEAAIQQRGLNAPRITPSRIDETIERAQYHVFEGSQLTVCCLTLRNGFTVVGKSACVSPENFDAQIGQRVSFEDARQQIWALEGYLLKQYLFEKAARSRSAPEPGATVLDPRLPHTGDSV